MKKVNTYIESCKDFKYIYIFPYMKKAEYIYRKLKQYYLMSDGENVTTIYTPYIKSLDSIIS